MVGTHLFERTNRTMQLTLAGQAFRRRPEACGRSETWLPTACRRICSGAPDFRAQSLAASCP